MCRNFITVLKRMMIIFFVVVVVVGLLISSMIANTLVTEANTTAVFVGFGIYMMCGFFVCFILLLIIEKIKSYCQIYQDDKETD